jgi:MFS family permease
MTWLAGFQTQFRKVFSFILASRVQLEFEASRYSSFYDKTKTLLQYVSTFPFTIKVVQNEIHWKTVKRISLVLFASGTILGSFFYGYIVLQIPGGYLAYRFGGTKVFGLSLFVGSLMTLLTPFVARFSVAALIVLRVLEGVFLVSYSIVWD